jgi:hypothetical protein
MPQSSTKYRRSASDYEDDTRLLEDLKPRRQAPQRRRAAETESSLKRALRWFGNFVLAVANIIVWVGLILSAWGGELNPTDHGWAGIVVMTLPAWIPAIIIVLILDCIWQRRMAIASAFVMLVCLPSMLQVFPLHIHFSDPKPKADSWTLLTYNIYDWVDLTDEYPEGLNPTLSYVLNKDADIVCLQEVEVFGEFDRFHLNKESMDSLMAKYKTVIVGQYMAFLSKYDAEPIPVDFDESGGGKGDIAGYRVTIGDRKVTIFNVHLRSIGLTQDDKAMYRDLTRLKTENTTVHDVRSELISKLSNANAIRGEQARRLVDFIRKYGGKNTIVCGDFKDVGMDPVWPAVGFCYQCTYNRNRFYFGIDHVLWRGDFEPIAMDKGTLVSSDHYPLTTTFEWKDKN